MSQQAWKKQCTNPIPVNEVSALVKLAETTSQISRKHPVKCTGKFGFCFCKGISSPGWLKHFVELWGVAGF